MKLLASHTTFPETTVAWIGRDNILPLFWSTKLDIVIDWQCFSFSIFNCLLPCIVSDDISFNFIVVHFFCDIVFFLTVSWFFSCSNLTTVYLKGVGLFGFSLLRVCWACWMSRLMFFIKFRKLVDIIFQIFFLPYSFSSLSETPDVRILVHLMLSYRSLVLSSFFFILLWSIFKFTDSFFYQVKSAVEILQWNFHFSCCTF